MFRTLFPDVSYIDCEHLSKLDNFFQVLDSIWLFPRLMKTYVLAEDIEKTISLE